MKKIEEILKTQENKIKGILKIQQDKSEDWEWDDDDWEWDDDWWEDESEWLDFEDKNYFIPNRYPKTKEMHKIGKNIYFVTAIQYWGIDNKLEYTKLKQNPDNYSLNPYFGGIGENGGYLYGDAVFIDTEENIRKYLLLKALKCDGYLSHLINEEKINVNLHKNNRINKKYLKKIKNILKKESYIRYKLWQNFKSCFTYTFLGENPFDGSLYWKPRHEREEKNTYLMLEECSNKKMSENILKYEMICIKKNNNYFYLDEEGLIICSSRNNSIENDITYLMYYINKKIEIKLDKEDNIKNENNEDIVYEMYYVDKKIELDILENKSKVNGVALKSCPPEEYKFGGAFLDYNTAKKYLDQGSSIKVISADHAILREFCLKKCIKTQNGWEDEIIAYSSIH